MGGMSYNYQALCFTSEYHLDIEFVLVGNWRSARLWNDVCRESFLLFCIQHLAW